MKGIQHTILQHSFVVHSMQAKFLFMVRDGRATVNSIISRKVTITGFDLTSYRQCMSKWNHAIETMHNQCKEIGSDKCMMVSVLLMRSRAFYCWQQVSIKLIFRFPQRSLGCRCIMNNWFCIQKNGCEKY